jgi:hypothetical protein
VNVQMSFSPERQQEVRRSILEFFEKQTSRAGIHPLCPYCGRAMTATPTTFSLCGTELTRTVPLFVCDCQTKNRLQRTA